METINWSRIILGFVWILTFEAAVAASVSDDNRQDTLLTGNTPMRQILERLSVEARTKSQHLPLSEVALMSQLLERMDLLEERDTFQQQQIDALKLELTNKDQEMMRMRQQIVDKDRHVSKLIRHCMKDRKDSKSSGDLLTGKPSRSGEKNRIRQLETEVHVAFTAGLTRSISHAGEHQNIVFDHVETNLGNAYNSHHGVFIAPVTGTYLFSTSVMAESNREIWCQIVLKGVKKVTAYAHGTDARFDQGSQAVIVHLQKGDDVTVQNYLADGGIFSNNNIWTAFSGFLLYEG